MKLNRIWTYAGKPFQWYNFVYLNMKVCWAMEITYCWIYSILRYTFDFYCLYIKYHRSRSYNRSYTRCKDDITRWILLNNVKIIKFPFPAPETRYVDDQWSVAYLCQWPAVWLHIEGRGNDMNNIASLTISILLYHL